MFNFLNIVGHFQCVYISEPNLVAHFINPSGPFSKPSQHLHIIDEAWFAVECLNPFRVFYKSVWLSKYLNMVWFAGEFPQGCRAFSKVSANVDAEEAGMKDDLGMQDVQYSMVRKKIVLSSKV